MKVHQTIDTASTEANIDDQSTQGEDGGEVAPLTGCRKGLAVIASGAE